MEFASGSLLRAYSQLSLHSQLIPKQTLIIILLHSIKITLALCAATNTNEPIYSATVQPSIFIALIMYYKSFSCSQFSQMCWELILSWSHESTILSSILSTGDPLMHKPNCNFTLSFFRYTINLQQVIVALPPAVRQKESPTECFSWRIAFTWKKFKEISSIFLFDSANSFHTLLAALKLPPSRSLWCIRRDVIGSGYC